MFFKVTPGKHSTMDFLAILCTGAAGSPLGVGGVRGLCNSIKMPSHNIVSGYTYQGVTNGNE